ncbi:MAG TPA: alkaline phosphatase family protein [Acidobacteriaceae bacterium]|nr:alkaline phosphatase family protein [Acidobacteriaceae bacterium]
MSAVALASKVEHVFVLMLENRAFDHMLGFSAISGTDAATGAPTQSAGLSGTEANSFSGKSYQVSHPADYAMAVDPGHEFLDVLCQLSGPAARYPSGGSYPAIDGSGFVASYAATCAAAKQQRDPGEILKCYGPEQLPVLNALAREFALCDGWHASMPGPTWPNRLFVHAASSGGLDHSPTNAEIALWEVLNGFSLRNGTIFDRLAAQGFTRRLYAGDSFPMISALKGIQLGDVRDYQHFAQDLAANVFPYDYIFIEPSYCLEDDFRGSTSEHPLADVTRGEGLIKSVYEAIRNSPHWSSSLLIVTWDEHGGFFDHAVPPAAAAPGDTVPGQGNNRYGFTFELLGPRVPAVVISPWIPKNIVDHRIYDHASIPATLEALFGLPAMTARDKAANTVLPLLTLDTFRTDSPSTLPDPADSGIRPEAHAVPLLESVAEGAPVAEPIARPADSVNDGNLPVVLYAAMRQDLELSPPQERPNILARFAALRTRKDAAEYMASVKNKIAAARLAETPARP